MNLDRELRSLADAVAFPPEPDIADVVVRRLTAPAAVPWWRRSVVLAGAVTAAAIILIVGLVPSVREEVASWLGIGGVTIETIPLPTEPPPGTASPAPTTTPPTTVLPPLAVQSGLGEGLQLGREIVSLTVEAAVGFRPLYPDFASADGALVVRQPVREFVDDGGRAWMLYWSIQGLPEMQIPNVGMIVTQFKADSSGILKQISAGGIEFIELGDGIFGLWLPGPHELVLPDGDGSAVNGRSAGNTLLWEQGGLTLRLESALSRDEAIAIAETFK